MKRMHMMGIRGGGRLVVLLALLGMSGSAAATQMWYEAGQVDKSPWVCKFCPYETGLHGEIGVGIGYVTDEAYAFGNYTGLDDDGAYGVLGADLYYRGEDAQYWRLNAARLGLDTRSLQFEGGRQGSYRATVDYLEIPRLHSNTALTPFSGVGGDQLRLPANWVEAGTTDAMVELDNSLHPITLHTDRRRLGIGLDITPGSRWSYSVNFRRERKEGLKSLGGSFLFTGTLLPEPVDYTTDQIELGMGYRAERWQVQLGYLGSFFKNEHDRLRWDNPFIEPVGNAAEGQLALAPDNTFHQVMASGNYRFSDATQATARLAAGQMLQNEEFLPYTVNPALVTSALPRSSLDGEVRTLTFDARVVSALNPKLTVQTDLRYHKRDNRTPMATFDYVSTDVFLPGPRTNLLYQHTDRSLEVSGRYRLTSVTRLSAGAEYQEKSRSDWEVTKTEETTLWAKASTRPHPTTELMLEMARAERDAGDYRTLDSTAPQNPLLVKFNLAEREQDRIEGRLHWSPHERLAFGVNASYRKNDYQNAAIGLRSSRDNSAGLDANLLVTKSLSVHLFATRENHRNEQAGSQTFSVPDWLATAEDIIDSHGIGATWRPEDSNIEVGVDYVYSAATGKTAVAGETAFPELKNRIHSANTHVRYRVTEAVSTELALFYEQFESEDWMVDGVAPATIPSVLTLGTTSPDYRNRAIALLVRYRF